ncbi:sulfurtransferase complex subunit TusB [Endozoicomonas ascidiicola]|uniref:sulfurtransferase complex subunit TusB n=1 Tax=Endozoicomonas ascidiicola TaxID=1698521 RepID=UPI00082A8A87|nr:sulfurtransferase complex subunit TusB [Endozoicomonas ascidiicola]
MKTLHTINKTGQPFENCLRSVAEGDTILLIEDGVYGLLVGKRQLETIRSTCKLIAMNQDLKARGIHAPDDCLAINYEQFVEQSLEHDKVISWF